MSDSQSEPRSRRTLRHDDAAVSEVVGQILTLGILSTLLIASLLGFGIAKDNTTERAVTVRGDALLQSISATAVQAALFAENNPDPDLEYSSLIDLPYDLEGHPYDIDLAPDEVFLIFPRFSTNVSAPLFQAGAGADITICDQAPFGGGPIRLFLTPPSSAPAPCSSATSDLVLYLEPDT